MKSSSYDIIIVGAGLVGSTLACALAQQTSLSIAILEAQPVQFAWSKSDYHHRVSAMALSSQRLFQALQVWEAIEKKRVSPFTEIQVWDAKTPGEIHFDSREIAESHLGFIIENNVIQSALIEKMHAYPQIKLISPIQLNAFHEQESGVEIHAQDGQLFKAKLAIAADGARSWLREQVGIELKQHDYQQEAIVATVQTDLPHQKIARQVFLETGPLAFLPLAENHMSSIVWSLPLDEAKRLMLMEVSEFNIELTRAFSQRLSEVTTIGKRFAFPLYRQQAKNYVKSRVVLVGDAAHTIHPLAGQGVNMGLLDAASLTEVIVDAIKNQREFSSLHNLRRYERWRKADNFALSAGIDLIKNLFASDKKSIQELRTFGLNLTNRAHWIKNIFTRHAVGDRGDLPMLAGYST